LNAKTFAVASVVAVSCAASSSSPTFAPNGERSDLARIAKQCALVASCADEHDSSALRTPRACVDWYVVNARDEAPLADCVMKARSCADMERCTHARADGVAESFCRAHPGVLSACDGNEFLDCEGDGTESTAVDCATLGGTCTEKKNGGLVERGCASQKLCPTGAPEHRCDGDSVIDCEDGIVDENACPRGSRCAQGKDESGAPTAHCRSASGRECVGPVGAGSAFCEGDVAYACVQNGHFAGLHSADCGALGLACVVRAGRVACTKRGASDCASPATCSGDELRFCAAGESFHASCKELGFARCDPAGGGGEALCATH
jgi:hypothetical protein